MYRLMLYFLLTLVLVSVGLSYFSIMPYTWWHILGGAFLLVVLCYWINIFLSHLFKAVPNKESAIITGLILALIVGPVSVFQFDSVLLLISISFLAIASKYLIAYKRRHIFNPAAFGVVASMIFLGTGASWWVGNVYLVPIIIFWGILISSKIKHYSLVGSFLFFYLVALILYGVPLISIQSLLLSSPLLFFSFVMLVEPRTTPKGKTKIILFGAFVAICIILVEKYFSSVSYGFELSLLLGNFVFYFSSTKQQIFLKLIKKEEIAHNIWHFIFEPNKKLTYAPGQFLEYSVVHSSPDSRGTRRYFTLASSPDEQYLSFATKITETSSSFKKALLLLAEGQPVSASGPEGDFILPLDEKRPLVFIAGGIGITPFRSMIKSLLDQEQSRNITLIYSVRSHEEIAFKEIFDKAKNDGWLKVVYAVSDESVLPSLLQGKIGVVDEKMIKEVIEDLNQSLFYVSGPPPMVESMANMLTSLGVQKWNVKSDFFPGYDNI